MKRTSTVPCGYSGDTEILTRDGWTKFPQLTYMSEVATRSAEGAFEWQYPERITCQPYEGEMVWFHGRSLDLLVTPGHEMPYVPDARSWERHTTAGALLERGARVKRASAGAALVATSSWSAPDLASKVFVSARRTRKGPEPREVEMTGDQFAAFMGMYISEGCAISTSRDWRVLISQTEGGKGWAEYRHELTNIFGFEPTRNGGNWVIWSRSLAEYLMPLGKAINKWLPADVLNLSRRQLEIFWHYYWLGDGNMAYRQYVVATASRALADGMQEVIQKLGFTSSVLSQKYRPTSLTRAEGTIYKLALCTTRYPCGYVSGLPYSGTVGRVQVPNGVVFVRRTKRPIWA